MTSGACTRAPVSAAALAQRLALMSAFGTKRTFETEFQCPLLGVKRTSAAPFSMSAFDPKRTLAVSFAAVHRRSTLFA